MTTSNLIAILLIFLSSSAWSFAFSNRRAAATEFTARTLLQPKSGSSVQGSVGITSQGNKLILDVQAHGVQPGLHGFHIHEHGSCSPEDASHAGEHFNPHNKKHGGPEQSERHVGDLGNVLAELNGAISQRIIVNKPDGLKSWSVIINKAVVLHKSRDTFNLQPSGEAGTKIACGVIKMTSGDVH